LEAGKQKPKAKDRVADANPESFKARIKEMEAKIPIYNLNFMPQLIKDKKAGSQPPRGCSLDRIDRF